MKKTLEKRIIIFAFIILFLTIAANSGMDIVGFRRDYIQALIMRSQSLGSSLRANLEKVVGLGIDVKDIEGLNDKCREVVASSPEVAYCIITDSEGNILHLNDPVYRNIRFDIIRRAFTTRLDQNIHLIGDDGSYYDTVTPVRSPDGKQVALIHIGFSVHVVSAKVQVIIIRSLLLLAVVFLVSFSLVVIFVKRNIGQPIAALLAGVRKVSEGEFNHRINQLPVYEFNELASSVNLMSDTLKNREEEIRSNYQELENIHNDLHSSYLKLESLSLDLEKSEELYKSLLEDASDAIVVTDENDMVKMVNKMAEDFFGHDAAELVGLSLSRMLTLVGTQNSSIVYNFFQVAGTGKHVAEEIKFLRKDKELVVGLIHANIVTIGAERLIQAIIRDVTREREILLNLEKSAADLARLNKMKDSFLGIASHELKTPLTVIMGYAELILTDPPCQVDPNIIDMVNNIAGAANRLDNIVKDMVDVSMIDEKRLQLKLSEVDVNRLVEDSLNELRFFVSMRKQQLVFELDDAIPAIKGDTVRLMQLLSNVIGNAIKFTPDGGRIMVSTRAKYILRSKQIPTVDPVQSLVNIGKDQHLYVEITVADTGIGIDIDDQLRIFDKFYEAGNIEEHSSGKVAFKSRGAGLGLSISKGIVEMHGGEIWVESPGYNPDQFPGSTFHIVLPLNPITGDGTIDYLNLLK
ncbi:sensor histidine kinase, HAMP and PAS domain-containing [Geobacter metallireducens GS-15]|uniref:histidine kinase n=1 Tax=Geobacter metallireducens (strain ATCC 53774 / DSM 7210 / GS-15) TaxID=269799 RepID=Q39UA0_GEOMG|nr:ATP-binding protein [Geobacter metallireducens]ABB32174.1 sensor histidine kinase, HAMP and PAS domain-containing [Geobacter metallireducens GS-15]